MERLSTLLDIAATPSPSDTDGETQILSVPIALRRYGREIKSGAVRRLARGPGRRMRLPPRTQWRRQDDDDPLGHGPGAADQRLSLALIDSEALRTAIQSRVYLSPHRRCLLRTERRNQGARWGLPSPDGELQYARRFHTIDDWISPATRTFVELSFGLIVGLDYVPQELCNSYLLCGLRKLRTAAATCFGRSGSMAWPAPSISFSVTRSPNSTANGIRRAAPIFHGRPCS